MKYIQSLIFLLFFISITTVSCMDTTDPASVNDNGTVTQTETGNSSENTSAVVPETTTLPGNGTIVSTTSTTATTTYKYNYKEVSIAAPGNNNPTTIGANICIPVAKFEGQTFPAIIFANSWALESHEYIAQAIHFAQKGYIVLEFSSRGWIFSGGRINLGGYDDRADFTAILDWLISNSPVDTANIGICGISLGGGTALNALAHDSRIKTAAGISAWTDLFRHMFSQETPRAVWGSILLFSGALLGNMCDDIYDICYSTWSGNNIDHVKEWCTPRSPITYIDQINKRNRPVYIANAMEDYLFTPDSVLDFFNSLTVTHKRVDLSLGTHLTGELTGVFGLSNYVFDNVEKWFDYWLKGIDNGIIPDRGRSAIVTMQIKKTLERTEFNTASFKKSDGVYTWPPLNVKTETFYCVPRTLPYSGKLTSSENTRTDYNEISSGTLSGATAGAVVSPILEQLGASITTNIYLLNKYQSIAWESPKFRADRKIRGGSESKLRISLNKIQGQIILYLYDVDKDGTSTYITHGFKTFWDAVPGQIMDITVPILPTAYDIPAGHHLAMVADTYDYLYFSPSNDAFTVNFYYGSSSSEQISVKVPFQN